MVHPPAGDNWKLCSRWRMSSSSYRN